MFLWFVLVSIKKEENKSKIIAHLCEVLREIKRKIFVY